MGAPFPVASRGEDHFINRRVTPDNMIRTILAILLWSCCGIAPAIAEDCPYAEYRVLTDLGQIQITTGFMDRTPDLASRAAALGKIGIVILETDVPRVVTWKARVGPHQVETTISMAPPVGHGEGGAASDVDLKVVMDGATLVDCPLSHALLGVDRMTIDPVR